MLPLHQKERYKYYGIEYRMPVKDMAAAAKVSLRFQKDVLKLHGLGYEAAIAAGWTMRLAIVLVPSYVAAYLTGEEVTSIGV